MIVGIDLGTTNSAVAVWNDGAPILVPNALGDFLTPSAVAIDEDGRVVTGLAARERMITHPERAKTLFKRLMGANSVQSLAGQTYAPEELSAFVLRGLKADAEAHLGARVDRAVITVPAYFSDKQRKATRRAGELAGLRVERLVNEPTAAALAYGIHELDEEAPFLVFDLGGGTFDVSILEIFDGVIEVRSTAGDNRLGGEDFNSVLVNLALDRIEKPELRELSDPRIGEVLRDAAERTRRRLSEQPEAEFAIVWNGERHATPISERDLEERAAGLLARLREPVIRSLRDGGLRVDQLSEIVMVGGATRMPIVRRAATRMFGRFPAMRVHPDHAVALGAAIQAALLEKDAALKEIRLTDVCPFSLGVETSERLAGGRVQHGLFAPIIERNTVIPASRENVFWTMNDGQRLVEFMVYQGESRFVSENIKLGSVRVPVPPRRAGAVSVVCRFSYDASGLLEIDVHVPDTGEARQLVIIDEEEEGPSGGLEERRAALAELKVHPREEAANVAVMARASRCFEAYLGEQRNYIGQLISMLQDAIEGQEPRSIERARQEVVRALDELEGEPFL